MYDLFFSDEHKWKFLEKWSYSVSPCNVSVREQQNFKNHTKQITVIHTTQVDESKSYEVKLVRKILI